MRIISGSARGRRLFAPKGLHTRPTQDRIREAIFNVLAHEVRDAWVLDAFAGSGAMGLEALSRGAAGAYFLENDAVALRVLRRNLELCGFTTAQLVAGDCLKTIPRLEQRFDLVFLDPPYNVGLLPRALALLAAAAVLTPGALVVVETSRTKSEFALPEGYQLLKSGHYGITSVHYCQYR